MDMSTYQTEDPCVTLAADYVAKSLRNGLHTYIGKSSINAETIAKIEATANTILSSMVASGVIKSYELVNIEQDTDDPMCLVMNLRVGVLYPLKKIDINIVLD